MTTELMRNLLTNDEKIQLSTRHVSMGYRQMFMKQCAHFLIDMVAILSWA